MLYANLVTRVALGLGFVASTTVGLFACGGSPELEACRLIEIEDAEVEVDIGDVDIERGEVEMVCDGEVLDVTWGEFRDNEVKPPAIASTSIQVATKIIYASSIMRSPALKKKEMSEKCYVVVLVETLLPLLLVMTIN